MHLNRPSHIITTDTILETITDGFVFYDTSNVVRYWNRQAEELIGLTKSEAIGRNVWDCFPEEVGRGFYQQYEKALKEQAAVHFEEYLQRADRWFEITAYPSKEGLSIYFRDVTERRHKEQELKESKQRFDYVLKATSEAISDYDLVHNKSYWHGENFKKLFGYDIVNTDASYNSWVENVHPDDVEKIKTGFEKAINNGTDFYTDIFRFKKSDESYALVRIRSSILRNAEGDPTRVISAMEDITEQRKAENILAENEKKYKTLFNNAPLPQYICRKKNLKIIKVNEAAILQYGYSEAEFLTMTPFDLRFNEDHASLKASIKLLEMKGKNQKVIAHHKTKSGEKIIVELNAILIEYEKEDCILVTIADITHERRLEEKISELKVSAQKSITKAQIKTQEMERENIGRELHDNINQQLTTIKLYMDLATTREDLRLDLIQKSEMLVSHTINEIRSLSKSLISPVLKDIGLQQALADLIDSFLATQKFEIHFSYAQEIDAVEDDLKLCFYRILQEQLTNISKHANAKNVWIDFETEDSTICITVKDDGKGFDPSKKRTGVGLSNIKNRIDLYNGSASIDSASGKGFTLHLRVPYEWQYPHETNEGLYIVIAEDHADDRFFLEEAFNKIAPQSHLIFKENGMHLLEHLQLNPDNMLPDLIVLDYNMPLLNGLDTLQALHLDPQFRRIPKIIYSTSSSHTHKQKSMAALATAYIEKGLTWDEIMENVRQMLSLALHN